MFTKKFQLHDLLGISPQPESRLKKNSLRGKDNEPT